MIETNRNPVNVKELERMIISLTPEERKELLAMWKQARRTDATA
jgi:hypothetical protein